MASMEVGDIPEWYRSCFSRALRRMAILLNSAGPRTLCKKSWLEKPDSDLETIFSKKGKDGKSLDQLLINLNFIGDDPVQDDAFRADMFFYGSFSFPDMANPPRKMLRCMTTSTFLRWSYDAFDHSLISQSSLKLWDSETTTQFRDDCATNYLIKNFWHNFVHREMQSISDANYHNFSGDAREESDFEADNIANILLVASYGIPVRTRGKVSEVDKIRAVLGRNRCNRVFVVRARHRLNSTDQTDAT